MDLKWLYSGAWWSSGIIAQSAIAPRQTLAQIPWCQVRTPLATGLLRPDIFHSATTDYLIMYPKLLPTLSRHFRIRHSFLGISRWSQKKSSTHHAVLSRSQACRQPCPLVAAARSGARKNGQGQQMSHRLEWVTGCNEASKMCRCKSRQGQRGEEKEMIR